MLHTMRNVSYLARLTGRPQPRLGLVDQSHWSAMVVFTFELPVQAAESRARSVFDWTGQQVSSPEHRHHQTENITIW